MLEKFGSVLHANDDILFYYEYCNKATFITNQRHILAVDLDKINLDNDSNFDEDNSATIIHVRLLTWSNKFKKRKALKKR